MERGAKKKYNEAAVGNKWVVLQHGKHRTIMGPGNFTPKYITQRIEDQGSNRDLTYMSTVTLRTAAER